MEMMAVIAALTHASFNTAPTEIFTDSSYVVNGITKWVFGWEQNGWKTKEKKDVLNKALWETLLSLVREREAKTKISWHLVPGHAGMAGNERCDEIATGYSTGKNVQLYRGKLSGYGKNVLNFSVSDELLKAKSDKKSKSSGKAFSYVSYVDGEIAVHGTWAECESRVRGKKARFAKALSSEHEAELIREFLKGE
jgi:ribonuclease HI